MDRVRRKEIIGISRRTWSKKHEDLFSSIPVELIIEILLKLPANSIAKLMFVSKHWSSIIREKYFTELYLTRSFTRPRLLFTVHHQDMQFFYSGSLKDLSSDHHHRLTVAFLGSTTLEGQSKDTIPTLTITTHHDSWYQFSPPIRGLICCLYGLKVLIGNPSTGQFVTLPRVKTKRSTIYSFFGYDPVNDLYKVLCMTLGIGNFRNIRMEEHQVFTLGAKQKWRMIECKHRHLLADLGNQGGICMNGVLYYLAKINDELSRSRSIISFNLTSEDFDVIKFPEDIRHGGIWPYNLVNYSGKIALTNYSCNGTLELWVQKDASKQEWSKASSLLVPSWTNLVGDQMFKFGGTLSTGELIFVPFASPNPFFFICYDLKENNARKVVIEGIMEDFAMIELFLEHVESPMFLPKVCQSDDD